MARKDRGRESTRERIVRATMGLHEEVGPAATTITAIAERAGVQRLTVYRHFPDGGALLGACSARWRSGHPFPDPAEWAGESDPRGRLSAALTALYGYFARNRRMLGRILADEGEVEALGPVVAPYHGYLRELAGLLAAGWGGGASSQRRIRAAVGHALRFSTWESLDGEGLSPGEAAELMVALVTSQAPGGYSAEDSFR